MEERIKRLEEENEQLKQNKEVEAVKPEAVKPEAEKFPMSSEEVDRLNNRIKALSDELYEYIGNQINDSRLLIRDKIKMHLGEENKGLSDELYEYIGEQDQRQKEFIETNLCR